MLESKKISNGVKNTIFSKNEPQRLDKFLVEELTDLSRSQIQKLIKDGQVKINGKNELAHYLLKLEDKVTVDLTQKDKPEPKAIIEPKIIFQTKDYLVIEKPAGLIVHPAEGIEGPTLVDWLVEKFPQIKKVGEDPKRPGIVHRLDKEVSGLMVIALTQIMFSYLKNQFQAHQIKKSYLALAYGLIPSDEGTIDFPLDRSDVSGKIVAKPQGNAGKESITHFVVLQKYSRYTLLKVTILTGRTHQIRVHLQAYGYPVVGDKLYANRKIKDNLKLDRLFLHSSTLGFYDLENVWQEFQSDLPSELSNILNNLK
jgi:23S rRNA pseudouridine1911/1915/1917 synthase